MALNVADLTYIKKKHAISQNKKVMFMITGAETIEKKVTTHV